MGGALAFIARGGPVMPGLLLVGFAIYALVFERALALYTPGAAQRLADPTARRRGLLVLRGLLGAAPLLGLLGTVTGMIDSFDGLTSGGRVSDIGGGIGQALVTTQYGLAIAAPGLVAERLISQRSLRLERSARSEG